MNIFTMDLMPLLVGLVTTLKVAAGAWLVALVLGLVITYVREIRFTPLLAIVNGFTTFIRAIPELVMLYVVYFGLAYLGLRLDSTLAAIIALGFCEAAFTAEYFRASMSTVKPSQRQAGLSLGLSQSKVLRLIILPQAIPFAVPPLLNSFIGLMKTATLASAVGAVELLYAGQDLMNRTGEVLPVAVLIVVIYIIITLPMTALVSRLEKRARARAAHA